jgi:glycosyltransferase involved in cell wall biosynthesis
MNFSINNPLVSIIIPVYNRVNYVQKTLDNIVNNKYRPIELILVDDGSTDNSLSVLNYFKHHNSDKKFIVKVLSQSNKGAPVARNLGFENSEGAYIQFLDSDDFIDSEKLNLQIELMINENAEFGLCDFEMVYVDELEKKVYHSNAEKLKKVLKTHGSFGCGSPLLKRELASKIYWNHQLKRNQDVDYFLKAALLAKKISYIEKPLYTYIRHSDERISDIYSKTAPVFNLRIKSLQKIFKYKQNSVLILFAMFNLYISLLKFKLDRK